MKLEPGTSVSHYRILSLIGEGGMGEVYLAEDTKLGRKVAIKNLSGELTADSERLHRFEQEARTASALNQPNILTIYEIGEVDDVKYIVTEFVDGMTLRELLSEGGLPIGRVLDIAIQIASALSAAHEATIIHRDIKPENVMVRKDRLVKILDFGLAKMSGPAAANIDPEGETRAQVITEPGLIMGTVLYMSPEQARGKAADPRSDIWSLGCVLYEMVSGRPPFSGESSADVIAGIVKSDPVHLSKAVPGIPDQLAEIVAKSLEKRPDERYQTVKDLLVDLRRVRKKLDIEEEIERTTAPDDLPTSSPAEDSEGNTTVTTRAESTGELSNGASTLSGAQVLSSGIRAHKAGAAVLGVVLLVILGGFSYGLYKFVSGPSKSVEAGPPPSIETQRLTGDGKTDYAAVSPDGKFLAYTKLEGEASSLWIKQIETNSNVQVINAGVMESIWGLEFSPDGNFIYFNGGSPIAGRPIVYRVPTLGGSHAKVFEDARDVRFSADGKLISFRRYDESKGESALFVANSDGSGERKLCSFTGDEFFDTAGSFSPDSKRIAVAKGDDNLLPDPVYSLAVISVADGSVEELGTSKWGGINDLVWHPSGDSLIIVASEFENVPGQLWDIGYPSGKPRRLTNSLNGHLGVSITADGSSIVTMERYVRSAIWVSPNLDPNDARQIMPSSGDTWGFSWTPDGRIVYVSDQSGDPEVWIMESDGSKSKQLTNDRIVKFLPVASPDGKFIVYVVANGGGQLVRMDMDGQNAITVFGSNTANNPDISPDGKWILFSAWVKSREAIFRIPAEGGELERVAEFGATEPRYSPDGKQIAYFMRDEKGSKETRLEIIPAEGGTVLKRFDLPSETSTGRGPVWSPDGSSILIIVSPGEFQHLWEIPLDGGEPKQLTNFGANGVARREFSKDGKHIAIVRGEGISNAIMVSGYR